MKRFLCGLLNSGPVTLWYKLTPTGYMFNHTEDGYVAGEKPVPRFDTQKGWSKSTWISVYAYVDFRSRVMGRDTHVGLTGGIKYEYD